MIQLHGECFSSNLDLADLIRLELYRIPLNTVVQLNTTVNSYRYYKMTVNLGYFIVVTLETYEELTSISY